VLAATALAGVGALRLRLSIRDADQLPQTHPYVAVYNEINRTFGGGWAVIVAIVPRDGDVFRPDVLEKIARITTKLEAMPELARGAVWSIAAERVKRLALVDGDLDVRNFPIAVLVIGLVYYEAFRTVQAMFLPLLTALLSVVCALGAMGWLGLPLDTWSAVTPVAILAIAAGHAVQILKRYYEDYAVLGDSRAAVISSIGHTGPVMVTAGLIAASGFASLATSR
jgi:predicted RND superfamily exporter protein